MKSLGRVTVLIFISLTGGLAGAEYRAFRLRIFDPTLETERFVLSTLDHVQYPQYHPLNRGELIEYAESWMCWENTAPARYTPICEKPTATADNSSSGPQTEP